MDRNTYGGAAIGGGNDASFDDDQGSDLGADGDFSEFIFEVRDIQNLEIILGIQNNEQVQKSEFKKFSDKERINSVFSAMDDMQKERFETFRQSNFDEKKMKKVCCVIYLNHMKLNQILRDLAYINTFSKSQIPTFTSLSNLPLNNFLSLYIDTIINPGHDR